MKFKIVAIIVLLAASNADAIIIRHDVADREYRELGQQFSDSVAYVGGCAATVIGDQWILTAAHCLQGKEEDIFFVEHSGGQYRIEKIFIHPNFDPKNDEAHDIALIQLKDPIATSTPALLYQRNDELGMPSVFVGRGTFGNGRDGLTRQDDEQRGATNTVDEATEFVLGFTFNSPQTATKLEGISSRGDSGGPAFVELNKKLYVIGVSSYQVGDGHEEGHYGVREYYTKVSTTYPWLETLINRTPSPEVAKHAIVDAVKLDDLSLLKTSIDGAVLANKDVLQEAFYHTIVLGRPDLAAVLINKGANFETVRINGASLFDFALQQNKKEYFEMLQRLASDRRDLHFPNSAVLPLFISAYRKDAHLLAGAQLLIKQGANVDAQTRAGDTPLILAGWGTDNIDLVKLLVSNQADVNLPNHNGDTPAMDAAYLGKVEILQHLIKNGADVTLRNRRGKTALQLAEEQNHEHVIELLRNGESGLVSSPMIGAQGNPH